MEQSKLEKLLAEYVSDSTNANILFQLALCYDELEQISPAISFYHICAENAENVTLKYECMLRAGLLTRKQENRFLRKSRQRKTSNRSSTRRIYLPRKALV